jgi:predicted transcriptional regulator
MTRKANFTVRLDDDTRARIDKLAEQLDRNRSWVIEEALTTYLDQQAWLTSEIRYGAELPENEPAIDHEALMQVVEALISGKRP